MSDAGLISYSSGAIMFLVLAALLTAGWEGRSRGVVLIVAVVASALWAAYLAWNSAAGVGNRLSDTVFIVEMGRNATWLFFMTTLLYQSSDGRPARAPLFFLVVLVGAVLLAGLFVPPVDLVVAEWVVPVVPRYLGLLAISLTGIVLVEQFFRNARPDRRWAVKYLCLGLLGLFGYDLYLYSEGLLAGGLVSDVWDARGMANAFAVPLIAIAAARNPDWSTRIFVSRHVVFYTASLFTAALFLVFMAIGGYYIRTLGGDWGSLAQIVFFFGSVILLLAMGLSAAFRARLRVFLAKHFYSNKYDYREEWLRFIGRLSDMAESPRPNERVVQAIGDLVDSTGGVLWLSDGQGGLSCVAGFEMSCPRDDPETNERLTDFWRDREWIIDLVEYREDPEAYQGLDLPSWLSDVPNAWLLVPLFDQRGLLGFVLLGQSRAPRRLNWEDWDLLKTAAREAANYLALGIASDELARARQFETFNRLSAYIVHDLKNLIAQLDLVVSNARRHQGNPDFMADAIQTVGNSVAKMKRLLAQLRKGRFDVPATTRIDLSEVMLNVVESRSIDRPRPIFNNGDGGETYVYADSDHLATILGHLVQNGQEAAGQGGRVEISLHRRSGNAVIQIEDTGPGMRREFIRERLFAPFDTTKGNAGMGIGAYEAREFVRALGGSLSVESEVGEGTVFTVSLPLAEADTRAIRA